MKNDYTHIIFLLDRSGSMSSCEEDVIGGFAQFLKDQQKAKGKATFTLIQFDDKYEINCTFANIDQVLPLSKNTFQPRGSTALIDAFCRAIDETGDKLSILNEENRPAKVLFVVYTDGFENASHKFKTKDLNDRISIQRDTYNWQFIFLGADQDAIATAGALGIARGTTLNCSSTKTVHAFSSLSDTIIKYRNASPDVYNSANVVAVCGFTDKDRDENKQ